MILEIHDTEEGNSLAGRVKNLDYDYQAEQWVQDICTDEPHMTRVNPLAKILLVDDLGVRAEWEFQPNGGIKLTQKSERFQGEWVLGLAFEPKVQHGQVFEDFE
jgi:hypothetical protein